MSFHALDWLNLLFPERCPLCNRPSDRHACNPICTACWQTIKPYQGPRCKTCGIPTVSGHTGLCATCLKNQPAYNTLIFYGLYDGALKEAIHLLKINGIKRIAKPLSLVLAQLDIPGTDAIVPVPLHRRDLLNRGFNQTAAICRHLSLTTGIPLRLDLLKKTRRNAPQTELSGRDRVKNVKGVYHAFAGAAGLRLLLLDDVITTGSTVGECAAVLKQAGAAEVTVLALARSGPKY